MLLELLTVITLRTPPERFDERIDPVRQLGYYLEYTVDNYTVWELDGEVVPWQACKGQKMVHIHLDRKRVTRLEFQSVKK